MKRAREVKRARAQTILVWLPRGMGLGVIGSAIAFVGTAATDLGYTAGPLVAVFGILVGCFGLIVVVIMRRSARAMFDGAPPTFDPPPKGGRNGKRG